MLFRVFTIYLKHQSPKKSTFENFGKIFIKNQKFEQKKLIFFINLTIPDLIKPSIISSKVKLAPSNRIEPQYHLLPP